MTDAPRLTPLGVMVLALLREGDMHPYEMARLLKHRRDDRMLTITNGSLYHTVGRLHEQKLVAEVGVDRDGNRPERTTYTLTAAGRDAVLDWVRTHLPLGTHPAHFRVALAEAHNLDRVEVIGLLTRRRAALLADRDEHDAGLAEAKRHGADPQFVVEIDRQRHLITADLDWTDTLLTRLDDPSYAWGITTADPTGSDA